MFLFLLSVFVSILYPDIGSASENTSLPKQLVIPVPYSTQIPYGSWVEPWANACEETSITMVDAYYGERLLGSLDAPGEILEAIKIKEEIFGKSFDESLITIQHISDKYDSWESVIHIKPTLEEIKKEIVGKRPVIFPFDARKVNNDYFAKFGFDYHVAVIVGYDDLTKEFVVNDPGMPNGRHVRYSYAEIMGANSSYEIGDTGEVRGGEMIFTAPAVDCPLQPYQAYRRLSDVVVYYITPACKKRPFQSSEIFFSYFSSWDDVQVLGGKSLASVSEDFNRFMPYGPKYNMLDGSLVKTINDSRVYLLSQGKRNWIGSETVFTKLGYRWTWVDDVSAELLDLYEEGQEITNTDTHPAFTLVKYGNNSKVYQIVPSPGSTSGLSIRHISDEKTFTSLGFRWDRIVTIYDSEKYNEIGPLSL